MGDREREVRGVLRRSEREFLTHPTVTYVRRGPCRQACRPTSEARSPMNSTAPALPVIDPALAPLGRQTNAPQPH
jgi:hypothetical protein